MTTPTENEMLEYDAWIAEHVMGYIGELEYPDEYWKWEDDAHTSQTLEYHPTIDPVAAMEVLKVLQENHMVVLSKLPTGSFEVAKLTAYSSLDFTTTAKTEELAICLFAKKLFSK